MRQQAHVQQEFTPVQANQETILGNLRRLQESNTLILDQVQRLDIS